MTVPTDQLSKLVQEHLGPFDHLESVGRGSFGETFKALQNSEWKAIKIIHHPNLPQYQWRREVETLSSVTHPNILRYYESGEFSHGHERYLYLACELIDGHTVREQLNQSGPIGTHDGLSGFMTGLLFGLQELHKNEILHRDIKPDNIMIRDGDWSEPVILDLGLAKRLDMSSHTSYPQHIGTIAYMAPEQLRGNPARRRSDLFAVGVVVYEALTGRHPFLTPRIGSAEELLREITLSTPPDPRILLDFVSKNQAEVIMRTLSFRAHRRLSVVQALEDLGGLSK